MPVATEIFQLLVKDGLNLEDKESSAASQWKKAVTTISEQPGFIRMLWGMQVENASILVGTIDWEDVQDHKNFINSEGYQPFVAGLAEICDFATAPPYIFHANFTSDSLTAREAEVTEFAPFNLPLDTTTEAKSSFEDKVLSLAVHCRDNAKCSSFALGWVLEEMENPNASDGKATVLQAIIGWPSVEDHMAARETPEFKELVSPIRSTMVPPAPGRGMFHVKLHGKPKD